MLKKIVGLFLLVNSLCFSNDQVVVSLFDVSLKQSENYKLEEKKSGGIYENFLLKTGDKIKSIDIKGDYGTLDESIAFKYTDSAEFGYSNGKYSYGSAGKKAIMIPVEKAGEKELRFSLTETYKNSVNENITTYLVEEYFNLPVPMGGLIKSSSQTGGVKFIYNESNDVREKHLKYYKKQEMMIRISKGTSDFKYDIMSRNNPYKPADIKNNVDDFLSDNSYMDFWVDGENFYSEKIIKAQNSAGNIKTELRYMPGHIELFGLPNGDDYKIEVYTFKYTKSESRGSLIVTRENETSFSINKELKNSAVDILSFSTEIFPKLKAKIFTVSKISDISLKMVEAYNNGTYSDNHTFTDKIPLSEVYIDGVKKTLVDGKDGDTSLYYYEWNIERDTIYNSINSDSRKAKFILLENGAETASGQIEYVINISTEPKVGYPHQTVYAYFSNNKAWTNPFEINDRTMNRYTRGYKNVFIGNIGSIENLYRGNISDVNNLTFNPNTYLWEGTNQNKNAVIIKKVKSDAKGTFEGGSSFTFYTQNWETPRLTYVQENTTKNETASFTWASPDRNTYTTVSTEKMLFRIVKGTATTIDNGETLPAKYFSAFSSDPLLTDEDNLLEFTKGNRPYADLIFDGGGSTTKYSGKASFTYTDNSLVIRDLARGDYTIQIYAIQGEDSDAKTKNDFNYKVITYGAYKTFTIGLPEGVTGGFTNENNVYMINNINMTPGLDVDTKEEYKDITVMFTTKTQKSILLDVNNLKARKDEAPEGLKKISTEFKVTEQKLNKNTDGTYSDKGSISNVSNLNLSRGTGTLRFPIDIVIAVGSHGIGQELVSSIKTGVKEASDKLYARGYDVKFNLIYYGSPLDIEMPTWSKYHARKIGINDTWNDKVVFDDTITYPEKSLNMIGNIDQLVPSDYTHMATFKHGTENTGNSINDYWFRDLTELNSALDSLTATGSYPYEDINSAWAIDRAADYLTKYGRYLNSNNATVGFSQKTEGDIPSEKMLILLTVKNMSSLHLPSTDVDGKVTGYTAENVVAKLSDKLSEKNIRFAGIFRNGVYTDNEAKYQNKGLNYEKANAYYVNYSDSDYGYNLEKYWIFNSGKNYINAFNTWTNINGIDNLENVDTSRTYQIQRSNPLNAAGIANNWSTPNVQVIQASKLFIKDKLGVSGKMPYTPSGKGIHLADFAVQNMGSNFNMYEIGGEGENADSANISRAFEDIVNNVSILQTWKMTYRSPFNLSDGDFREVIFSLDTSNIFATKYNKATNSFVEAPLVMTSKINPNLRIYRAPEVKLESYFVNPDESSKTLVKKDGKIILEALSSSQYRKDDGKLYNHQVIKGSFVITDSNGNTHTVSSETAGAEQVKLNEEIDSNKKTWYRSKSSLDLKTFYKKFGRNPILTISFTAETNENIGTIVAKDIRLKEEDPPKITKINFSNETAKEFLSQLKIDSSQNLFKNDELIDFTFREKVDSLGLTQEKLEKPYLNRSGKEASKLNVKNNDRINIEIIVDDENIYKDGDNIYGTVGVNYNNQFYPMTFAGEVKDTEAEFATKSKWILNNFVYTSPNRNLNFVISDSVSPANTYNINPEVFEEPPLIAPVKFKENTNNPMAYTNYYNSDLEVENHEEEALAYISAFEWDKTHADTICIKDYPLNGKNWTSSKSKMFPLFDGKYNSNGLVYGINKAGGISITSWTDNTIGTLIGLISAPSNTEFYVDRVKPEVKEIVFRKDEDIHDELNKVDFVSQIINGPIGESYNRAYKENDIIKTSGKVKDVNFAKFSYVNGSDNISLFSSNTQEYRGADSEKYLEYSEEGKARKLGTSGFYKDSIKILAYDKAGNPNDDFSINILYDERATSTQKTKYEIFGEGKRFTKDSLVPLETAVEGVSKLAVGKVGEFYGDLRDSTNRKLGLFKNSSGKPYPIMENKFNSPGNIIFYSYAGVMSERVDEGITVDTKINSSNKNLGIKIEKENTKNYSVSITEAISKLEELVGIEKFQILEFPESTSNVSLSDHSTYNSLVTLIGATYESVTPKASNLSPNYNLSFTTGMTGKIKFKIRVWDRLGNNEIITFSPEINTGITIIGRTTGSNKEIKSKAGLDGKIKVRSE